MIFLYIAAALLLILFALGMWILCYACGKYSVPDYWDGEILDKRGYSTVKKDVLEGKAWLEKQDTEDLEVISYDGKKLHSMLVPCNNARGSIILFHGWHSSWKLDFGSVLPLYNSLGFNLIICDQRSFGNSQGSFTCFGVKERHDVVSWATYAAQLFGDDHPIFLGGISMGASTVLMAAGFDIPANVRGIIADCGFTSPYEIMECVIRKNFRGVPVRAALLLMGIFSRLIAGFGLKEANTVDAVSHTRYPVLFIHGKADHFVPVEMSVKAYEACSSPKTIVLVEDAGHGMSYPTDKEKVTNALLDFLETNIGKENSCEL